MPANFERVAYFLCVCECGSVSKAAAKLYISPQALNKQIRALEAELGEPLFRRTSRTLSLSDFGVFFRNQMQPVCQLYQTAQTQVAHYLDASRQTLRVGFFQGVPKRQVIQPLITELMIGMPNVQIELGSAEMDEIYADLRSGKTDLAITNVNPCESLPDLVQIPLLAMPCSIVVSYLHPWMVKETVGVADMEAAPVLFLSRANGPDKEGFYGNLRASSYHFAPTYNAMLAQLGTGRQYAVFPTLFENLSEIGLKMFPLPEECRFEFSLALLYRPDNRYAQFFSSLSSLRKDFQQLLAADVYSSRNGQ